MGHTFNKCIQYEWKRSNVATFLFSCKFELQMLHIIPLVLVKV